MIYGIARYVGGYNERGGGDELPDEDPDIEMGGGGYSGDDDDGGGLPPPDGGGGGAMTLFDSARQAVPSVDAVVDMVGEAAAEAFVLGMRRRYPVEMRAFDVVTDMFRNGIIPMPNAPAPVPTLTFEEPDWSDTFAVDAEGFTNLDSRLPPVGPGPTIDLTVDDVDFTGGPTAPIDLTGEDDIEYDYSAEAEELVDYFNDIESNWAAPVVPDSMQSSSEELPLIETYKRLREQPQPEDVPPAKDARLDLAQKERDLYLRKEAGRTYFEARRAARKDAAKKFAAKTKSWTEKTEEFKERYQTVLDEFYASGRKRDETADMAELMRPKSKLRPEDAIVEAALPSDLYPEQVFGNIHVRGLTREEALNSARVAAYEHEVARVRMRYEIDFAGPSQDRAEYGRYQQKLRRANRMNKQRGKPAQPIMTLDEWRQQQRVNNKRPLEDVIADDMQSSSEPEPKKKKKSLNDKRTYEDAFGSNSSQLSPNKKLPDLDEDEDLGDFFWNEAFDFFDPSEFFGF